MICLAKVLSINLRRNNDAWELKRAETSQLALMTNNKGRKYVTSVGSEATLRSIVLLLSGRKPFPKPKRGNDEEDPIRFKK